MDSTLSLDSELLFADGEELRLDKLLRQRYPHYSRTYFQRLIEQGFVLLDGEPVKKRAIPEEGEAIEVCFQLTPELSVAPEPIPLDILYEDAHLIAVNKPAGLVVHPAPGHWSGTFVNALLHHCQGIQPDGTLRPGIVHRLDKETSGVLVAAKTADAHQALTAAFANRQVKKTYLAICTGRPPNGRIIANLGRHPTHRKEMAVLPDGKEAITDIEVLAFNERLSLVQAHPHTGRTHQIRVHLKHVGAPVLGDKVYGRESGVTRHMLHASRLSLAHPVTREPLELVAPIPEDFSAWAHKIRDC